MRNVNPNRKIEDFGRRVDDVRFKRLLDQANFLDEFYGKNCGGFPRVVVSNSSHKKINFMDG